MARFFYRGVPNRPSPLDEKSSITIDVIRNWPNQNIPM